MIYPVFQKKLKFYLFANDTNSYYEIATPKKLAKKVKTEHKYVKRWLDASKLSLNINKTYYMIFNSPAATLPVNRAIKIDSNFIPRVKCIKFLGQRSCLQLMEFSLKSENIFPLRSGGACITPY